MTQDNKNSRGQGGNSGAATADKRVDERKRGGEQGQKQDDGQENRGERDENDATGGSASGNRGNKTSGGR